MYKFCPPADEIEKFLVSKGIELQHIDFLKNKKRVIKLNQNFYDYKVEETKRMKKGEFIDIPVSKIVSTHRTRTSYRTWWDNIFNPRFNDIDDSRWNRIYEIIKKESLKEFRESLYLSAPPLESVTYYPDYDVYEVAEGHHRTVWAILTKAPTLKTEHLIIKRFDKQMVDQRISYYKKAIKTKREFKDIEEKLSNLIEQYNLSLVTKEDEGQYIYYKDYPLYYLPNYKALKFRNPYYQDELLNNVNSLDTLNSIFKQLKLVLDTNRRLSLLPISLRRNIIFVISILRGDDSLDTLNELYSRGWKGKRV